MDVDTLAGQDPMLEDGELDEAEFPQDEPGVERTLTEDGGVKKRIITVGTGWETPQPGDHVTVHYVGTLEDGTQFDSSRDRDEPFSFQLGQGQVIKGWDVGVAAMKKGEKALLTISSDYGYGASGSPPKIPGGATLLFEVELLSWKSSKDLTGDGGVLKTVLTAGDGWQTPSGNDDVVVSLLLRAHDADDPNVAKGDASSTPPLLAPEGPVTFSMDAPPSPGGAVCSGVLKAVTTMKVGESARIVCKGDYAVGTPGLQPGQALEAEVKLLELHKVTEVAGTHGGVIVKTLTDSDDWKRPNEGSAVVIRYKGKLPDGTVFEERGEGSELAFKLDDEEVCEGLDLGITQMKAGTKALITIRDAEAYGFGKVGRPAGALGVAVPPDTPVSFEVELVSFQKAKERWEMNAEEKLAAATERKERGNTAYKAGKLGRAVRQYTAAADLAKSVGDATASKDVAPETTASAKEVRRSAHLNLAAAHLRLKDWGAVVKAAGEVLEAEPTNIKALYRRAQALLANADFIEAERDIKVGLGVEPDNADLQALSKRLKATVRAANKKDAAMFSKMFTKGLYASMPAPAAAAADANGHADAAGGSDKENDGGDAAAMDAAPVHDAATIKEVPAAAPAEVDMQEGSAGRA